MEKIDNKQLTKDLLAWYDANARILPWREEPTPYRVWVSEIMLQQTRVEAVKPYFERFIEALPDIDALAHAKEDTLRKLWEGLGYYHRVSNMKKAAIQCMERYQGQLPSTYDELLTLSGIGSYSAGAIASIAFKQPVPAVDGNVLRVFSRVWIIQDDILKESTKKKFQKLLMDVIPNDRPDAFNQAVMEIGAMVCVPNAAPKCHICPLAPHCKGYQQGVMTTLPIKAGKKKRTIEKKYIDVVIFDGLVLLQQRDKEGLLAGLYEFNTFDYAQEEAIFLSTLDIEKIVPLKDSKHIFTHKEWHMSGKLVFIKQKIKGNFVSIEELENQYAIPTAYKAYKEGLLTWMKHM